MSIQYYVRLLLAYLAILSVCIFVAPAANAATYPLAWQDMSSMLPMRQNRPVWSLTSMYLTDGQSLTSGGHVWRNDNGKLTDVTAQLLSAGLTRVDKIVDNVKDTIFVQLTPGAADSAKYAELMGVNADGSMSFWTGVTNDPSFNRGAEILTSGVLPKTITDNAIAAWNGQIWMIINGKQVYVYDNKNIFDLGRTKDYFTCLTASEGAFWLGGAASTMDANGPTMPLKAVLVRITQQTLAMAAAQAGKIDTVRGKTNRINYWAWFESNDALHDN